jgi:hypothetical protein
VRINAATEQSINMDVDSDGTKDASPVLFYDPAHVNYNGNPWPSLIAPLGTPPQTAVQALEITALAELPNKTKKLLQYVVAPIQLNLSFGAALTLDGNGVQYTGPGSSGFLIRGSDQYTPPGSCAPGATPVYAIGYTNTSDAANIVAAENPPANYQGTASPSHGQVVPAGYLSSLTQLNSMVQMLIQNADHTITPGAGTSYTAYGSDLTPFNMSATAPQTIVVNGNLDLAAWHNTGYGVLLVTGELKYDPDAFWDGIVLVVGKGKFTLENNGIGQIEGALFVAQTVDSLGNPLSSLGAATFAHNSGSGGNGIYYSSCWINYVQSPMTYKILSFHELPQ